jgi:hypothetical protein
MARAASDHAWSKPKTAWLSSEKGPRDRVTQQLLVKQMEIVLRLALKWFDVESVYGKVCCDTLGRHDVGKPKDYLTCYLRSY